jgi:hypothetical protein
MLRKYVVAYVAWLAFIAVAAAVAVSWYRKVEQIGWQEVADRLRDDDTEHDGTDT